MLPWASAALLLAPAAAAQNSSAKIRIPPSAEAARAGQAVEWRADLKSALAESQETGKPVFWYVVSVRGSFMDRSPEVDWSMTAGPFSWPRTVALLNEHFIPVRGRAGAATGEKYGLTRIQFIEPGYLILDGEGTELAKRDRLTTLHPGWLGTQWARVVNAEWNLADPYPTTELSFPAANQWFVRHPRDPSFHPGAELRRLETAAARAEALYLYGCGLHDNRREVEARAAWLDAAKAAPDHPLAAAALMEAEEHGPYQRGLATFEVLPGDVFAADGVGSQVPEGALDPDGNRAMALRFLLRMQRADGSWRDSIYDFGGTDGLPNVYMAISALCTTALLEPATAADADRRLVAAHEAARLFLLDETNVNEEDRDERIWAHLYRMTYWNAVLDRAPAQAEAEQARAALADLTARMLGMQDQRGAWYHEYSNPFVTASCLIELKRAAAHGVTVDGLEEAAKRGIAELRRCRTEDIAYTYGMPRGAARASVEASVGRAPLGELALSLWEADDADLSGAIARSFEHEAELLLARKYDDHTNMHGYGGFFFWYDMHARTMAIAALPEGTERDGFAQRQRQTIHRLAEIDGAFIDSHEVGRSYGTALALVCLMLLDGLETR